MDPAWFTSSSWCHALTLGERIATLSGERGSHSLSDEDVELGRQRTQRWRSQPPFDTDSYFAQRLALDGIDEEHLVHILGEPVESLHGRLSGSPAWLAELATRISKSLPFLRVEKKAYRSPLFDQTAFPFRDSPSVRSVETPEPRSYEKSW